MVVVVVAGRIDREDGRGGRAWYSDSRHTVPQRRAPPGPRGVRYVQIIRDPRSGKSKGLAYIEFYQPESVFKALACTGQVSGRDAWREQTKRNCHFLYATE